MNPWNRNRLKPNKMNGKVSAVVWILWERLDRGSNMKMGFANPREEGGFR
jgi:hypothetical protein